MTKAHEQLVVRPISEQLELLTEERGEFTLVVSGKRPNSHARSTDPDPDEVADEFGHLTENESKSRREALRALATRYDISAREVFALLERAKKSVN